MESRGAKKTNVSICDDSWWLLDSDCLNDIIKVGRTINGRFLLAIDDDNCDFGVAQNTQFHRLFDDARASLVKGDLWYCMRNGVRGAKDKVGAQKMDCGRRTTTLR